MKCYLELIEKIICNGQKKSDRTGTGTVSLFGAQMRFDLEKGFPVLTTKKIHFRSVVTELLWFLKGDTYIDYLHQHKCRIWDEWADEKGYLGPIYGKQWRAWETPNGTVDQIKGVVEKIRTTPDSRRLIVSAWNPADLPDESISPHDNVAAGRMALAPCHMIFQFYVSNGRLSCQFYARSQDFFIGTPFNIASYALLTVLMARETGYRPGELIWVGGDVHIYLNHLEQAKLLLRREPYALPTLSVKNKKASLFDFKPGDFELRDYQHHPAVKAQIAV